MAASIEELTRTYPARYGFKCDFERADDIIDNELFALDVIGTGTFALAGVNGPGVLIAGAATTDNDGHNVQAINVQHRLVAGRTHRFINTFALYETTSANGATESDIWFGAMTLDASIIASQASLYGVFFRKDEGDANIDCCYCINSAITVVQSAAATLAQPAAGVVGDNTTWEIRIQSGSGSATSTRLEWIIDGRVVASTTIATLLASNLLLWSLAYQTGDATGTKGMILRRALTDCNLI